MAVTGASCRRHAPCVTDIAVLDRGPVPCLSCMLLHAREGAAGSSRMRWSVRHCLSDQWRSNGSLFRMELTAEQDRAPIVSARAQAASSAPSPCGFARRMMPRQDRNPCSGVRRSRKGSGGAFSRRTRSRRITSTSVAVFGPIFAAQLFSRSGDHSEWRVRHCRSDQWRDMAHLAGMCSEMVVCWRLDEVLTWAATRLPRWNISTVRVAWNARLRRDAVSRTQTFSRSRLCGAE